MKLILQSSIKNKCIYEQIPDWHVKLLLVPHWHGDRLQSSPCKAVNGHGAFEKMKKNYLKNKDYQISYSKCYLYLYTNCYFYKMHLFKRNLI